MRARSAVARLSSRNPALNGLARRQFCTSGPRLNTAEADSTEPPPPRLPSRWLVEMTARVERCKELKNHKLERHHHSALRQMESPLEHQWLDVIAGGEGFLTGTEWRGLDKHGVVWGDMDSMVRHVNNIVYNRYAESSRVNWVCNFPLAANGKEKAEWAELMTPRRVGLILKTITTDFKFPVVYPDQVTVIHRLTEAPDYSSSNIMLEAIVISERHKRIAARCFEDIAVYDYQAAKKSPLKPFMVDRLKDVFQMQETNRLAALRTAAELGETVTKVEGWLEKAEKGLRF